MARRRREETTDRDSAHAAHEAHAVLHEQHKKAFQVALSADDDSSPQTPSAHLNSKQPSNHCERARLKPNAIEPKTTNTPKQTWSSEAPPLPYTADNRWSPTKQAVFQRRPRLSVGQHVLAKYYDSDEMYDGVVLKLNKDGNTFHVMFADGLEDPVVPSHNINVPTATPSSTASHAPSHSSSSSQPEPEEHQPPHNHPLVDGDWGGAGGASISAAAAKAATAVVTGSSSWMAARVQREREAWEGMGEKNRGEEGRMSSTANATSMALALVLKSPFYDEFAS